MIIGEFVMNIKLEMSAGREIVHENEPIKFIIHVKIILSLFDVNYITISICIDRLMSNSETYYEVQYLSVELLA